MAKNPIIRQLGGGAFIQEGEDAPVTNWRHAFGMLALMVAIVGAAVVAGYCFVTEGLGVHGVVWLVLFAALIVALLRESGAGEMHVDHTPEPYEGRQIYQAWPLETFTDEQVEPNSKDAA